MATTDNYKDSLNVDEGVRERLVLSGIAELVEHGFRNFSLRRVASAAQVSCAAPYRHFKSKDELMLAVIRYVRNGWSLLAEQINKIFESTPDSAIIELCVSGVRFWVANGSFRSILFGSMGDTDAARRGEIRSFDTPIREAVVAFAKEKGLSEDDGDKLIFSICSVFWGTVMLAAGEENGNEMIEKMKTCLCDKLSSFSSL